jgi:hypothetical protein
MEKGAADATPLALTGSLPIGTIEDIAEKLGGFKLHTA